ncbi:MAG TPA: fibronectin type III domain-containing protein [Candidatus Nitrosotalea sp.]|nr:fibronectin type III domain-containing protein [Candidatus Nitrosotalea sp.]
MRNLLSILIAVILCILILVPANFNALATSASQDNQAANASSNGQDNNGKAIGNPHNKSVWCTLYNEDLGEISEGSLLAYLHFCVKGVSSHRSENPHPPPKVPIPSPVSFDISSNVIPIYFDTFSNIIPVSFVDQSISTPTITQINNDPSAPNGTKRTQSEVSIAVSGNNVVAGYNDNQDPNTSTYSGYSYSNDGGKTWTDGGGILPNPGDFDANDPSLAADSKGNFYFSMLVENGTFTKVGVAKSTDGGKTFSNPVIVDSINASATPAFLDKDYIGVGKNPANPSQDIIHITYTRFTTSAAEIVYKRSLDGGKTWQDSCTLNPGGDAEGAMPVTDPTGKTVYVFYQDFLTSKIVGWKNTNAGAGCNWTRVTNVGVFHSLTVHNVCGGEFGVWNGNHRATDIPVEAVGPNGNIYVTWNDSPDGGKTTQIVLYRSQDGGNTWTGPQTFNPTPGRDQFEPWIAVAPNGKITMIFYDRVNDPANLKMDLYAASSTDNGTTWQPNQRITPSSFSWGTLDPPSDPYFFSCYFIGDYQSIAFDSNNVAHIAWSDGRVIASDGTPDPNVFYAHLVPASVSSIPQNLQATTSDAQVSLSWTAPINNGGSTITGYKIYRSTSSGTESFLIAVGNVTSYTDTGLTNGITYYYKVTAVNSVGESAQSNEANAIPVTVPPPPTSLAATAVSSSQINLNWSAPSGNGGAAIIGYKIERSNDTGTTWNGIVPNTNSTSTAFSDTGLASNTQYEYRVSAINSVGTGQPSNTVSATTKQIITTSTLTINSQDSSGNALTGFHTELYAQNGTQIADGFTPYNFTLNNGQSYTVSVDDFGKYKFDHWKDTGSTNSNYTISISSNEILTAVYATAPQPPTSLAAKTVSSSQINLSWTAPTDNGGATITGYDVYRGTTSGSETLLVKIANVTSYNDIAATAGQTYYYKVAAINFVGKSALSNEASATTFSITKVQSGLVVSDSLTTGNTSDLTLGGTATKYNYYEDSQGLHIGVQSPSSGNWVNYYADTPQGDGLLYHVLMTIPQNSIPDGVFNPSLYVEGSDFIPHVGCGGYADSTGYYWAVGQSYDAGKTYTMLYISNPSSLPHTQDCTIITNGDNYLKVYIGGKLVYSNSSMSLKLSRPFVTFVQDDTSSAVAMNYATFSNYYITTDEKIQVTNIPSNAVTASLVDSTGKTLASSSVTAGAATLNVGMYDFPLSANINIYDSNNALIASGPASIYGGDVFSVTH